MNQNDTALLKSYLGETPHQIKATFVTTPPRSFLFPRGLYFKKFIKISKDKCISVQDKNQPPPHASLFLSMYCSDLTQHPPHTCSVQAPAAIQQDGANELSVLEYENPGSLIFESHSTSCKIDPHSMPHEQRDEVPDSLVSTRWLPRQILHYWGT